jgi:hypothetical protein
MSDDKILFTVHVQTIDFQTAGATYGERVCSFFFRKERRCFSGCLFGG